MQKPPVFLETSPDAITAEMIAAYEASTGKTLYPAQVERLLVDFLAYRESLVRQGIQAAAEQNLVDFATGARLEALGALVGVPARLAATPATCTWRITLPQTSGSATVFPAGWKAVSPDGVTWQLAEQATVPAGQLTVDAPAEAVTAGSSQNGIPTGAAFSPLEGSATVVSLDTSSGGAEAESDDQLRERLRWAPFGFSVAGGAGPFTYQWFRDGVPIPGATADTLDIPVVHLGESGFPVCVEVTGPGGTVRSKTVPVTVTPSVPEGTSEP